MTAPNRACFFHPVMGMGGAERLLLQVAGVLRESGMDPEFWVSRLDPATSFPELHAFPVHRIESRVPESPLGRLRFWTAFLRLRKAVRVAAHSRPRPGLLIFDLIPHLIPLAKQAFPGTPLLGYCHFPDQLLAPGGRGALYRAYRRPIDAMEARGWRQADLLLCNSRFTRNQLLRVVPGLDEKRVRVLHPTYVEPPEPGIPREADLYNPRILVLGRFHPDKKHDLAIRAFHEWKLHGRASNRARLLLAGSWDPTTDRHGRWLNHLRSLVHAEARLRDCVEFRINPGDPELATLWNGATALLYPPLAEHFGMVPLEAMTRRVPVIAVNAGGPAEVIQPGQTGLLADPDPASLARALETLHEDGRLRDSLVERARLDARKHFGPARFRNRLRDILRDLPHSPLSLHETR